MTQKLIKKICLIGATGVGKTSLVQRFVQSIYSEKYHLTLGVKVDKKEVSVGGKDVTLMIWDMQGEDDEHKIRPSFLRGASGYLLVADLSRPETIATAHSIQNNIEAELGKVPFLFILNKLDLVPANRREEDAAFGFEKFTDSNTLRTSAKSGEFVEEAFQLLTMKIVH